MDDPLLFSWSDSIRAAFVSCLPCLHRDRQGSGEGEASQQLQGLLADADTETEETLSLHSRHTDPRRRRRKTFPKRITIFGYNLFGRRPPAIQLPPDGEDDEGLTVGRGRRARARLDSDAAPLDASAISALASTGDLEQEQEHDERRRKRRERKELKRAAAALALQSQEDFEGFPGTGSNSRPGIPSPFQHHSPAHTNSNSQRSLRDTFARQPSSPHHDEDDDADLGGELYSRRSRPSRRDDEEEDGADLGGELYARRTTTSGNSGSRGSDSQSRTSANSQSQSPSGLTGTSAHYHHRNYTTKGQPQPSPHMDDALGHFGPKRKKKKSTRKSSKTSNSTASQSPSLPSPTQLGFPQSYNNNNPEITDVQLEGFSGGGGGGDSGIGFPSTGFGRRESGKRDMAMGAFLARVGDV